MGNDPCIRSAGVFLFVTYNHIGDVTEMVTYPEIPEN